MRYLLIALLAFNAWFAATAYAADAPSAEEQRIAREKMAADKKFVVSENLKLTDAESKGFWPVYEAYQADQAKLNDRLVALIQEYAMNFKTMTDDKATKYITERLSIEADRTKLAQSYLPKFGAVLPGTKVAHYFQVELRINLLISLDIAKQIPMVGAATDKP